MTPTHLATGGSGPPADDAQTVVVGVKLDVQSRELLTWSLVKLASPGDCVIALHVMGNHEIVDLDGKSSVLSVVEAFDSVLTVYEGFCNLKQVDLKLKVCRGSSIGKVLVREAESCSADKLILGTSGKHHKFRSSASVAKYCAKKLSKDCCVLAVNNGKIMFHREASLHVPKAKSSSRGNYRDPTSTLDQPESVGKNLNGCSDGKFFTKEPVSTKNCAICSPESMAVVPLEKLEVASSSVTLQIKEILESRPGSPLVSENLLSGRLDSDPSLVCQSSIVPLIMQSPSRDLVPTASPSVTQLNSDDEDVYSDLDGENDAMFQEVNETLPLELEALRERYSSMCRLFSYKELQSATSNFAPENLIGKGGSSRVYQGSLPDGNKLAVKILRQPEDVLKEFVFEIDIITSLDHKNIISLLGFCFEDNKLLLVYDLLPRGSLEDNLHGTKKDPNAFGWNERYKVAVGVAEAVHYLHKCNGQPVIHRDVKSSNILLSDDYEPQLSDFGLAKWAPTSTQKAFCDIAGTFGYMAPEYFMFGKVTDKIDVYAYGVVLLELLSGRKPISSDHPKGQESLVMWVGFYILSKILMFRNHLISVTYMVILSWRVLPNQAKPMLNGGKVTELLDPSLGPNHNLDQMERMVLAANLCIRRSPRARPKMSLVLKLIQGDAETMKWARLQVNTTDNPENLHPESYRRPSSIQCHLNLALLDVEDDSLSVSSIEQNVSLEDYLKGRCSSRSSSFD